MSGSPKMKSKFRSKSWFASFLLLLLGMSGGCSNSNQQAVRPAEPQQNSASASPGANQPVSLSNEELKTELMKASQFRAAGEIPEFQRVLVSIRGQLPTTPV